MGGIPGYGFSFTYSTARPGGRALYFLRIGQFLSLRASQLGAVSLIARESTGIKLRSHLQHQQQRTPRAHCIQINRRRIHLPRRLPPMELIKVITILLASTGILLTVAPTSYLCSRMEMSLCPRSPQIFSMRQIRSYPRWD